MGNRKVKINTGLNKLLKNTSDSSFFRSNDVFVGDSTMRMSYLERFSQAQLCEIAYSK